MICWICRWRCSSVGKRISRRQRSNSVLNYLQFGELSADILRFLNFSRRRPVRSLPMNYNVLCHFYFRFCRYGHRDGRFCLIFARIAQQSVYTRWFKWTFQQQTMCVSSRLSKVIDLGVNREPECDFLLVIVGLTVAVSSTVQFAR